VVHRCSIRQDELPTPIAGRVAELRVHLRSQRRPGLVEQDAPAGDRLPPIPQRKRGVVARRQGRRSGTAARRLTCAHDPPRWCRRGSPRAHAAAQRELSDHHGQDDQRQDLLQPHERADSRQRRAGAHACGCGGMGMVGIRAHLAVRGVPTVLHRD
jgi:hypothetical protein